ncbi:copper resistance CopC family protein [Corynebacterium halotolerans]|uniref:CopC domain-containing protein n=1 Tax=Corynebacterium halotolerans YIM 70093 = DSM 44683 TaxID=1121362 RepID=M1N1R1_9CORY|nr:copper resistance CopC family protein [Corynebacterium halotolerans]AGF73844.1 hypothetical protein A605_14372 [Corynebacterium halotolerans YIM 70093 = DSM 44683]
MIISLMPPRRVLAAVVAAGVVAFAAAPAVLAHDAVIGGNPADGAVVEEFPPSIELEFSGLPREGFSTLAITDQNSGEVLFSGEPTIDGQSVVLDLPADVGAGPGDYTVGFQIISSDGHATRNATTFTVAGDAAQPADTATTNAGADQTENTEEPEETATAGNAVEEDASRFNNPIVLTLAGLAIFGVIAGVSMLIVRGRDMP